MQLCDVHAEYHKITFDHTGSLATVHLPVWHADVEAFVKCKTQSADADTTVSNLSPVLWIPDVFMERVLTNEMWSLFDPPEVPRLQDASGQQFTTDYESYEREGRYRTQISARDLWNRISTAQAASGYPSTVFQCTVNEMSNQRHLGLIRATGRELDIAQRSTGVRSPTSIPASIAVHRFVRHDGSYDFDQLHHVVKLATKNCDRLLDTISFPTHASIHCSYRTRALAISTHGLAEVFIALGFVYGSPESRELNRAIFETIYHAALDASCDLAEEHGPYPDWKHSPAARGVLHIDMASRVSTKRFDFKTLRSRIARHGLRNSVITTQPADSSRIFFDVPSGGAGPHTSNIVEIKEDQKTYRYIRPDLVNALMEARVWSSPMRTSILWGLGSLSFVGDVPHWLLDLYRTAQEVHALVLMEMAADRAPFVEQIEPVRTQDSYPSPASLKHLQTRAWDAGLKTGVYHP
ncbi:ribonucleotide reductase large subunit [Earliella scabrosa]|nr:ribonucleotide reductase large subunit [Earliella scabrosa]